MVRGPEWMRSGPGRSVELHTDRPHAARVYDFLLGGKTNYAADREAARRALQSLPNAALIARQNRAFMHRAARYLAQEGGIRQFLDIGTGIPTPPNLHEVVQSVAPASRIVYADNDPIVLTHSRALHTSHPAGRTAYLHGDLCKPQDILGNPELTRTLDLDQPVALTLVAVLHWLPKQCDPYEIVARLLDALPGGSFLALTHVTDDFERKALAEIAEDFRRTGSTVNTRSKAEVAAFFEGLELVEPGIEVVHRWRPDAGDIEAEPLSPTDVPLYGAVARKR